MKFRRIVELIWLAVAAVATVEAYVSYTKAPQGFKQRTFMLMIVFFAAIFMYFLRKRQRSKMTK